MNPQDFCYWLQGLLELSPDLKTLSEPQVQMIRDHLGYVFTHIQASKAKSIDLRGVEAPTFAMAPQPSALDGMLIC